METILNHVKEIEEDLHRIGLKKKAVVKEISLEE